MKTLGLDLGTNSIGWAILETDGEPGAGDSGRIVASGVRIFSQAAMAGRDAQSKISLAAGRREARGARRRRDRYLKRRARLLDLLTQLGLMPEGKAARDALVKSALDGKNEDLSSSVYGLRAKALDTVLTPHELGRTLFHLNQRRGFKSNRKTDSNEKEAGKISTAVDRLREQMAEDAARTFGEWLHLRRLAGLSVRARMTADGAGYDFYPSRDVLEEEFRAIKRKQQSSHRDLLSDAAWDELYETIFFQRPLKPVVPGQCSYEPAEKRLPKCHPLFQKFRLLKEVNELVIEDDMQRKRKLSRDERDVLLLALRTDLTKTGTRPFSKLRRDLKLSSDFRFTKESDKRKALEGDVVAFRLSRPECFGAKWAAMTLEAQEIITEKLRTATDTAVLVQWLQDEAGLNAEAAHAVADAKMPEGYGRLGRSALTNLIDSLENETNDDGTVITETEASIRVYGKSNAQGDPNRKGVDQLPKYQTVLERHIPPGTGGEAEEHDPRWDEVKGRITNPTVHIALNQLRRVVNALIKKHGKPDRIAIELGRDLKLNKQAREEIEKANNKNRKDAIRRSALLEEQFKRPNTGEDRLKIKLWEELDPNVLNRCCIYTGKPIPPHALFNNETEIDHILPYSKTLDDSFSNKILCFTSANREKKNRAPAEVPQWRDGYEDILARATVLPKNKRWRFAEDAMERFSDDEGFLARHLTDMQYISRLALTYLAHLYDHEEPGPDGVFRQHGKVRGLPGRMTEMLRRTWDLNGFLPDHEMLGKGVAKKKNRLDHRHHAIDAIVIASTSRSLIQKLQTASAQAEAREVERVVAEVPVPWESFRNDVRAALGGIIVSHKPDHGTVSRNGFETGRGQTAGKLHNDTAYGLTGDVDDKGKPIVVVRKPITSLGPKDIARIRGNAHGHSELRDRLWEATRDLTGKDFQAAILNFVQSDEKFGRKVDPQDPNRVLRHGIRHVRLVEPMTPISMKDKAGTPYKAYKGDSNHAFDVWELPDGKWKVEVVSTFDVHQPGWVSALKQQHPTARRMFHLQQGDMVALEQEPGRRRIMRVVKFSESGGLALADHTESGALKQRDSSKDDPFKYVYLSAFSMKKFRARQVRIDEIGCVFDPGVWWRK
ncbi:MAG: type II CRISPR RNA-guided endonuclease Cas9 [Pseudomonadota bacterium]